MELDEIRKLIDEVDGEMLPLLEKRLRLAQEVAEYKRLHGGGVLRPEREIRRSIDRRYPCCKTAATPFTQ